MIIDKATIIAIAVSCLFLVYLIPVSKVTQIKKRYLVLYPPIFFCLGMIIISLAIPDQQKVSADPMISGIYRNIDSKIGLFNKNLKYKNIIVISGGSLCNRGIDPQRLENNLASKKYDSIVIQICLPGANHFERSNILQYADFALGTKLLRKANLLFLRETSEYYDNTPLAQLNAYADQRTIAYMSTTNTINALSAQINVKTTDDVSITGKTIGVVKSFLMNFFNIGLVDRMSFEENIYEGHTPLLEPIEHKAISLQQFQAAYELAQENQSNNQPASQPSIPQWLRKHTYNPGENDLYDRTLYFLLPTYDLKSLAYFLSICRSPTIDCIKDESFSEAILELADDAYWYDGAGHLMKNGAEIATNWLSHSLVSRNILQ